MTEHHRTLIEQAIRIHGSQVKLAEAMGCSQQQVSYMLKADRVSAEMATKIDSVTGGQVSRSSLRPDLFGAAPTRAAS